MRWTVDGFNWFFCSAVCAGIAARLGADRHCDDGSKRWWNLLGMPEEEVPCSKNTKDCSFGYFPLCSSP
jgi:hypothetical protein